jgi:hypothetical protein
MKRIVPLLLLSALLGSSLHAMDVKHYRELLKKLKIDAKSRTLTSNQTLFFGYFTGLGEGLGLANATLLMTGKPMLFCAPSDLELTPDDYADLVDKTLADPDLTVLKTLPQLKGTIVDPDTQEIGAILLLALIKTYPCK